jgi:adenine-specific DNA-methyltransferase
MRGRRIKGEELDMKDEKGPYRKGRELNKWGADSRREDSPSMWFPIEGPNGEEVYPIRNDGSEGRWRWGKKKLTKAVNENDVIFTKRKDGTYIVYQKIRESGDRFIAYSTFLTDSKFSNALGTEELKAIFSTNRSVFDYPKSSVLVSFLLRLASVKNDDIVLDSFAGSATTAHSVLNLNKEDEGNRKFILVEMEDYAEDITAERVKRVMDGYGKGENKVEGTGGEFEYLELGDPLFDENGYIYEKQPLEDIRKYVYYSETRTNKGYSSNPRNEYYLGKRSGTAYYFYYKKDAVTTLDLEFASEIKIKAEQYIVYADRCTLSDKYLEENNIIFKKIPRDITKI